jgi:hypothetical protein
MLDVHLFMGWKPKHVVPEGEEYHESEVYYGRLPTDTISFYSEFVLNSLNNHSDLVRAHHHLCSSSLLSLTTHAHTHTPHTHAHDRTQQQALYKVTLNAYKQYHRTRTAPSPESVKRAKQLPLDGLHPCLARFGVVAKEQVEAIDFISSLKKFRPPQTVLEMQHGDVGSKRRGAAALTGQGTYVCVCARVRRVRCINESN